MINASSGIQDQLVKFWSFSNYDLTTRVSHQPHRKLRYSRIAIDSKCTQDDHEQKKCSTNESIIFNCTALGWNSFCVHALQKPLITLFSHEASCVKIITSTSAVLSPRCINISMFKQQQLVVLLLLHSPFRETERVQSRERMSAILSSK